MNRTLVLCKPDAVERRLVGEILNRFETKGLSIVAMRQLVIDADLAGRHYAEHAGKPFYDGLVEFIGRSPAVALVLEGTEDTWSMVRNLMGATNPAEAAPGTIRGDLGTLFTENLVHGSDSAESAAREIAFVLPRAVGRSPARFGRGAAMQAIEHSFSRRDRLGIVRPKMPVLLLRELFVAVSLQKGSILAGCPQYGRRARADYVYSVNYKQALNDDQLSA